MKVFNENIRNFQEAFDIREQECGDKILIRYPEGREIRDVSASEYFRQVRNFAKLLQDWGYHRAHIGIIGINSYAWAVVYSAILYSGNVAILYSPAFTEEQIEEAALLTDTEVLLYDKIAAEKSLSAQKLLMSKEYDLSAQSMEAALLQIKDQNTLSENIVNTTGREDLNTIIFTSGTTGRNKAVMISTQALFKSSEDLIMQSYENIPDSEDIRCLTVMPFHHLAGFFMSWSVLLGGDNLCIGTEITHIFWYLTSMKPNSVFVVPALLQEMARRLKKVNYDQKQLGWNLVTVFCGGAKLDVDLIEEMKKTDIIVTEYYSASELCGQGLCNIMTSGKYQSIGRPLSSMEIRIEDGELQIRCPAMMMGYYKDPELTAEVLTDGWYHTGDLCTVDEDGFYYLTGRKKNLLILSNGENVSPEEIETRIHACPHVLEVLVYEQMDRIVCGVYPEDPESEEEKEEIRAFVSDYNQTVPGYKKIYQIVFRDQPFEKTATGKILRYKG